MATDYRDAVRRSLINKIAIYLQQSGSRDMTIPLNFNQGVAEFIFGNTTYGIVPREIGQPLFFPGINITFLDDQDAAPGRAQKKRWLLPVKITVLKQLQGSEFPQVVAKEVRGVMQLILQCLSDGHVHIWDYEQQPAVDTKAHAFFHTTPFQIADESIAEAGGDIRQSLTIFVNYIDLSI